MNRRGGFTGDLLQSLRAIGAGKHLETFGLKDLNDGFTDALVVFHHQHPTGGDGSCHGLQENREARLPF